jgi:hypothetical protein
MSARISFKWGQQASRMHITRVRLSCFQKIHCGGCSYLHAGSAGEKQVLACLKESQVPACHVHKVGCLQADGLYFVRDLRRLAECQLNMTMAHHLFRNAREEGQEVRQRSLRNDVESLSKQRDQRSFTISA